MILTVGAASLVLYAYAGYPFALRLLTRAAPPPRTPPTKWPAISITLPVHNGAATIGAALESILTARYPGPRQILVVSDGSTDATCAMVERYADHGVELCVLPQRVGKTTAENRAAERLRGEIVVNTDASVRLHPDALLHLVIAMRDPAVGVASACDVSVGADDHESPGESAYVGQEMRLRELETRAGGIIGASGCLYAIRASLHRAPLAGHLSRDFASALRARLAGYSAVSVAEAVCYVPRARAGIVEYRRKVRTMARGLATLAHFRRLLDPFRWGGFAWRLASHKLARWAIPPAVALAVLEVGLSGTGWTAARAALAGGSAVALIGWWWPGGTPPRPVALVAYGVAGVIAGLEAWVRALLGQAQGVWEPTPRAVTRPRGVPASPGSSAP